MPTDKPDQPHQAECDGDTLSVTHLRNGEEVVTAGEQGQTFVATFASPKTAQLFVKMCKGKLVYGTLYKPG